ncbi:hypothetical protein KP509_21G061800 [Ceratopteris richardii]|uniref:Uncharacterized protein n=1 Tax=Ceratopteris richardii TaxID=49495 RepID=A0A8T2SE57_CERRI|nr:hypothetical protein KP509_21G061800 [Ceratopteris richardii]
MTCCGFCSLVAQTPPPQVRSSGISHISMDIYSQDASPKACTKYLFLETLQHLFLYRSDIYLQLTEGELSIPESETLQGRRH